MRTSIGKRVEAYNYLQCIKDKGDLDKEKIEKISNEFNIPQATLYDWYKYDKSPFGKRKIKLKSDLFYIIGALLGDGCAYHWKKKDKYMVIVSGEKEFIEKYSDKLANCIGRKIKGYPERSKNVWHLRTWNIELYQLLRKFKDDKNNLAEFIKKEDNHENVIQFIEGYFDAEGCVKVIREPTRKTPKICLDICSVDYPTLEIIRKGFEERLEIEARYSIQKPDLIKNKQIAYHLRIYKKAYIRKFFEHVSTIKLKSEKVNYVNNWLNNGK